MNLKEKFERSEMILGKRSMEKLAASKVAVFGIGGVGGYACEALARTGIGEIHLIDKDTISLSNINRQIIADTKTIGEYKTKIMAQRIKLINPEAVVHTYNIFYNESTLDEIDFCDLDYVVDAIDTVSSKILLIQKSIEYNVPVISCMGAGNKLDPTKFEVADISETSVCPLARVMRRELKKRGIDHLKVVYSKEIPGKNIIRDTVSGKSIPGSVAFVPSVAGLIAAGQVIKDISSIS